MIRGSPSTASLGTRAARRPSSGRRLSTAWLRGRARCCVASWKTNGSCRRAGGHRRVDRRCSGLGALAPVVLREHGRHGAGKRGEPAPISVAEIGGDAEHEETSDIEDGGGGD